MEDDIKNTFEEMMQKNGIDDATLAVDEEWESVPFDMDEALELNTMLSIVSTYVAELLGEISNGEDIEWLNDDTANIMRGIHATCDELTSLIEDFEFTNEDEDFS